MNCKVNYIDIDNTDFCEKINNLISSSNNKFPKLKFYYEPMEIK